MSLELFVAKLIGATLLGATLLIASCGDGKSAQSSPSPNRTPSAASASASPTESPATFTSATYGYTVVLPERWSAIQAQKAWDGKAVVSSDSAEVDQFVGTYNASSWGLARASKARLASYTASLIARNARDHGDTCPAKPEGQQKVTIGGDPGTLLAYNCGILINLAATIHHGVGYMFGFRDPTVNAATDPADMVTFLGILKSVQFSD